MSKQVCVCGHMQHFHAFARDACLECNSCAEFRLMPKEPESIRGMVRNDGHDTSVDAAEAVAPHLSALQAEVEQAFQEFGNMNDHTLEMLPQFEGRYGYSTVRKRRTDLYNMGRLVKVGHNFNERGQRMIVWGIPTDEPEEPQVPCDPNDGGQHPIRLEEGSEALPGVEADGAGEGDPRPGTPADVLDHGRGESGGEIPRRLPLF